MIKRIIKDKCGGFSIIYVIIAFITILIITGFVDILGKTFTINEIQSIMDVAGVSSLQAGVDQQKLRLEIFEINESFVRNSFKTQVLSLVNGGPNINSISINDSDITFDVINNKWGLGTSNKARPQAVLDTVAKVKIKSSVIFDTIPVLSANYYRSLSKENFTVTYNGKTNDGYTELIIRSVSRIVYR